MKEPYQLKKPKMENKTPIIKETVVAQVDKTDLDLVVEDDLLGVNPEGHECDWVYDDYSNIRYWREGNYISVEMLQGVINDLKVFGTTHVQIYHHGDHRGYYFTGVKLEVMNDEELLQRKKLMLELQIKNGEIAIQHEAQELVKKRDVLDKLQEELNNLK